MTKTAINRAPVLSLWSLVVAQRLGHSCDTMLSLARSITGMRPYAKAKSIGLAEDRDTDLGKRTKAGEERQKVTAFMGWRIPIAQSPTGPLALANGKPIQPKSVDKYLASKFDEHYDAVHAAMAQLAGSRSPSKLAVEAFHLYEAFRPSSPAGVAGLGKAGMLDLKKIARPAGFKTRCVTWGPFEIGCAS